MKKIIISLFLSAGVSYMGYCGGHKENHAIVTSPVYAALPVLETYVPQPVVDKLRAKYGASLYDITLINASTSEPTYVIRTGDDGSYTCRSLTAAQIQ